VIRVSDAVAWRGARPAAWAAAWGGGRGVGRGAACGAACGAGGDAGGGAACGAACGAGGGAACGAGGGAACGAARGAGRGAGGGAARGWRAFIAREPKSRVEVVSDESELAGDAQTMSEVRQLPPSESARQSKRMRTSVEAFLLTG
jgi:hypothetical protein